MGKRRVVIFVARYLCYASNATIVWHLAHGLEEQGLEVEICNLMTEEDTGLALGDYVGGSYQALIDFNSTMPRAMVGDKRFLDLVDAPFYNYILDHPLYHHPILSIPLQNYHVICLDQSHAAYIKTYYPHIQGVHFLPLGGLRGTSHPDFFKRHKGVLFTGSYYPPEKYAAMMDAAPSRDRKLMWDMADLLLARNQTRISCAPEEAYAELVTHHGIDPLPEDAAIKLNQYYPAEYYARAVLRRNRLLEIAKKNIPLWICGNGWQGMKELRQYKHVSFIEGTDYNTCVQLTAAFQVVLNIMPGFTRGTHDRMYLAMLNGAVCLTETNEYVEQLHKSGTDCLFYDKNRLKDQLSDKEELAEIAARGEESALLRHTYRQRAKELAEMIGGRDAG